MLQENDSFFRIRAVDISLMISLSFFISCITPVQIENVGNDHILVVDGKITQKNIDHELKLSLTSDYGDTHRIPVPGARIQIFNSVGEKGNYIEKSEQGTYYLQAGTYPVSAGEAYFIEIQLKNGKMYRSIPQKMPRAVKPMALYHKTEYISYLDEDGYPVKRRFVNIYIDTPIRDGNQKFYFLWRGSEAYSFTELNCNPLVSPKVCYVKRNIPGDDIKIFSGEDLNGQNLTGFLVASVPLFPAWEFYERHFYNIVQFSLSPEAYNYWSNVKEIATPTGSIFDTPPAPIPGNIRNVDNPDEKVLGFFEVSAADTIHTYTTFADFTGMSVYDRCNTLNYRSFNDPPCCNCLRLDDSDTERPYYWDE